MSSLPRPLALRGDAYTSAARTPWGGTRLVRHFGKRSPDASTRPLGESWELSLGAEFPSRIKETNELLAEAVRRDPAAWLGGAGDRSAGLVVKLLDAEEPLSLQIHPPDDHPGLAPDESGKPEGWYVIHAEAGAWIAFGWRDGVHEGDVRRALGREDGTVAELLQKVPVQVGDCFVVDAGTPHAIGPGVSLVEPQWVARGRRGVTYRYWDWDRRYDADGRPSASGALRELATDAALAVTHWERAVGATLLTRARLRSGAPHLDASLTLETLASAAGPLRSKTLHIARVSGTGELAWPPLDCLQALTIVAGRGRLVSVDDGSAQELSPGVTIAIPARHTPLRLEGRALHGIRSSIEAIGS